ncbi:MAG: hypothetical protein ACK5LC_04100 [Coprobacillaceae bacterium]
MKRKRLISACIDFILLNSVYFIMQGAFLPLGKYSDITVAIILFLFIVVVYGKYNGIGHYLMGIEIYHKNALTEIWRYPITRIMIFELVIGMYFTVLYSMFGSLGLFMFISAILALICYTILHLILFWVNKDYWNKKLNIKYTIQFKGEL